MSTFFTESDPEQADDGGSRPSATGPSTRRRRRARGLVVVLVGLLAVVLVAVAAGASYVATVSHSVSENLRRADELPPDLPTGPGQAPRPTRAAAAGDAVNYVLLGSDSRTSQASQGRSDVLMVLHLAGDRRSAALISFPRDLYVSIPGHGKDKINAAYALGGPSLTIRTLEGLLGTRMDHVALVDFAGFIDLTEQLGGVTVDNPHPSVSQGYAFPRGRITVRGPEALAYVREREQLPRGDLDRAERQRLVAQAVLAKGLARENLLNPVAFNRFAGGLARSVTVDRDLTMDELRRTALSVRFRPGDIESLQAPVERFGTTPSGQSVDLVDTVQLAELAQALREDRVSAYAEEHPGG